MPWRQGSFLEVDRAVIYLRAAAPPPHPVSSKRESGLRKRDDQLWARSVGFALIASPAAGYHKSLLADALLELLGIPAPHRDGGDGFVLEQTLKASSIDQVGMEHQRLRADTGATDIAPEYSAFKWNLPIEVLAGNLPLCDQGGGVGPRPKGVEDATPSLGEMGPNRRKEPGDLCLRDQVLENPVGRDDQVKPGRQAELGDIPYRRHRPRRGDSGSAKAHLAACDHRGGEIDPVEEPGARGHRHRHTTGAATQFEHRGCAG